MNTNISNWSNNIGSNQSNTNNHNNNNKTKNNDIIIMQNIIINTIVFIHLIIFLWLQRSILFGIVCIITMLIIIIDLET